MLRQGRALLPSPPRLPAQLSPGTAQPRHSLPIFPAVWEAEGESERAWRAPLCLFILLCRPAAKAVSGTVPVLTASAAAGAREACSRLFLGWLPVEGRGGGVVQLRQVGPSVWLPLLGATGPSTPLGRRCRGSRGQG